jgi:hypothetical protein
MASVADHDVVGLDARFDSHEQVSLCGFREGWRSGGQSPTMMPPALMLDVMRMGKSPA